MNGLESKIHQMTIFTVIISHRMNAPYKSQNILIEFNKVNIE